MSVFIFVRASANDGVVVVVVKAATTGSNNIATTTTTFTTDGRTGRRNKLHLLRHSSVPSLSNIRARIISSASGLFPGLASSVVGYPLLLRFSVVATVLMAE